MVRVKICGINSADALAAATDADWIGLNFFPASPRYVTPAQAAKLRGSPTRVGLFVEPDDAALTEAVAAARLDIIQVYADADRAAAIRRRFGRPVWRSVGVAEAADLPAADEPIDGYVIEAKPPAGVSRPGGNATTFDWSLLRGWSAPKPWLLAGGLTPANVQRAIEATGAPAVDVSSGVERERGVKDPALIHAFIESARLLTFA